MFIDCTVCGDYDVHREYCMYYVVCIDFLDFTVCDDFDVPRVTVSKRIETRIETTDTPDLLMAAAASIGVKMGHL